MDILAKLISFLINFFLLCSGLCIREFRTSNIGNIEYKQSSAVGLLLWCSIIDEEYQNDRMPTMLDSISIVFKGIPEHHTKSTGHFKWLFVREQQQQSYRRFEFCAYRSGSWFNGFAIYFSLDGKSISFFLILNSYALNISVFFLS